MSVDYYAVAERDEDLVTAFCEGEVDPAAGSIDPERLTTRIRKSISGFEVFEKDFASIARDMGIYEEEAKLRFGSTELNWEADGYIQINVSRNGVSLPTVAAETFR